MDTNKDNKYLVSAAGLHKTYHLGKTSLEVLRGVSLEIGHGEFVAIYGHSGSGKSTLLHLLGLLDEPSKGSIAFDGYEVAKTSARKRNHMRCRDIGFVFQFYYLLPELTVLENTLLPGMVDNSSFQWLKNRGELKSRACDILAELGLGERLKHRPKELSGGERQRVAIARALLHAPKLLLADEPTGNLDSKTGRKIMDLLLKLNREKKQTILMVTHDNELAGLVDRCLYLQDGVFVKE
ncbi:MAG TPA: ABC transporter ATP-binding protein [Phycisphaerae bacterium]|nr:ABC transporter ATP-binding protein [Phycisphaerae bacterium]HPS52946.1 ABC transporter ATP-binding protein [Phycisphaerae bacterium]